MYPNREIFFNDYGARSESLHHDDIDHKQLISLCNQQSQYEHDNGCVWLSLCIMMHFIDDKLASILTSMYKDKPSKFEWLRMFSQPDQPSLAKCLSDVEDVAYRAIKLKCVNKKSKSDSLLHERHAGYFIAILVDNHGNSTHAVGINKGLNEIYDPMEEYVLPLNQMSLNIACGKDRVFKSFGTIAEIVYFRKGKRG